MNSGQLTMGGDWLNPEMLRWAREWRGRTIEEVAAKFKKEPEQIIAWETSAARPTVKQARKLADFYGRSFVEFFLPEPPKMRERKPLTDFRMHRGVEEPVEHRDVQLILDWAEAKRDSALDLFADIGEPVPEVPKGLFATTEENPEEVAANVRKILDFPVEQQMEMKKADAYKLPSILRQKIEHAGILTLKNSELNKHQIRGVCIAKFPLPVIVCGSEAATAQAFTLVHELAHITLQQGGVSGFPQLAYFKAQPVERWCDQFAAAFLMPLDAVTQLLGEAKKQPSDSIDDAILASCASAFRVSPHAMLIRLVHLGYVASRYYWEKKRPEFDEQEASAGSFGRSPYYGSRYRNAVGDLYTGLVLQAWSSGRISNHNAAEYMGIKNIKHLRDVRSHYGAS
ncbi:ImmA/IrrE family metallo-endopeptidase [Kordiimonas sp.]|uniref:ImmA/IrrE family metallo-endopeptidase n=1 Tax=Kordiimonas sp. TaxID=1970157 RepID=UPI003A8E9590